MALFFTNHRYPFPDGRYHSYYIIILSSQYQIIKIIIVTIITIITYRYYLAMIPLSTADKLAQFKCMTAYDSRLLSSRLSGPKA